MELYLRQRSTRGEDLHLQLWPKLGDQVFPLSTKTALTVKEILARLTRPEAVYHWWSG